MEKNLTTLDITGRDLSTMFLPGLYPDMPTVSGNPSEEGDGRVERGRLGSQGAGLGLPEGGLRYDVGKLRLDLLPPEWEWELGRVLTAGAKKYADRNWELGMPWSQVVGPLRRHLNKWLRGEQSDRETGAHHLAHVAWNALALMSYDLRKIGEDNLGRQDCIGADSN